MLESVTCSTSTNWDPWPWANRITGSEPPKSMEKRASFPPTCTLYRGTFGQPVVRYVAQRGYSTSKLCPGHPLPRNTTKRANPVVVKSTSLLGYYLRLLLGSLLICTQSRICVLHRKVPYRSCLIGRCRPEVYSHLGNARLHGLRAPDWGPRC